MFLKQQRSNKQTQTANYQYFTKYYKIVKAMLRNKELVLFKEFITPTLRKWQD